MRSPSSNAAIVAALAFTLSAQQSGRPPLNAATGEWPMFNRDLAATRYSPLTQIDTKNVAKLSPAWFFKVGRYRNAGSITGGAEVTPIVVQGVMYLTTAPECRGAGTGDRPATLEP